MVGLTFLFLTIALLPTVLLSIWLVVRLTPFSEDFDGVPNNVLNLEMHHPTTTMLRMEGSDFKIHVIAASVALLVCAFMVIIVFFARKRTLGRVLSADPFWDIEAARGSDKEGILAVDMDLQEPLIELEEIIIIKDELLIQETHHRRISNAKDPQEDTCHFNGSNHLIATSFPWNNSLRNYKGLENLGSLGFNKGALAQRRKRGLDFDNRISTTGYIDRVRSVLLIMDEESNRTNNFQIFAVKQPSAFTRLPVQILIMDKRQCRVLAAEWNIDKKIWLYLLTSAQLIPRHLCHSLIVKPPPLCTTRLEGSLLPPHDEFSLPSPVKSSIPRLFSPYFRVKITHSFNPPTLSSTMLSYPFKRSSLFLCDQHSPQPLIPRTQVSTQEEARSCNILEIKNSLRSVGWNSKTKPKIQTCLSWRLDTLIAGKKNPILLSTSNSTRDGNSSHGGAKYAWNCVASSFLSHAKSPPSMQYNKELTFTPFSSWSRVICARKTHWHEEKTMEKTFLYV